MQKTLKKRLSVSVVAAFLICVGMVHHTRAAREDPELLETKEATRKQNVKGGDPWSEEDLMKSEDLARLLSGEQKPIVLQIGVVHLYRLSHVAGSKYAGPANTADGLEALKKEAQSVNRDSQLVLYCGCCPWENCPNTRPAYKALKEMGFKKLKVLYLPQNFTQDWSMMGFPVEKSA